MGVPGEIITCLLEQDMMPLLDIYLQSFRLSLSVITIPLSRADEEAALPIMNLYW